VRILVAAPREVLVVEPERGTVAAAEGLEGARPTCLVSDPATPGRAWCGTSDGGLFRSDDGGASWRQAGLRDRHLTAVAVAPAEPGVILVGTEPSDIWRSEDDGGSWRRSDGLDELPSSSEWSFPPRPDTHHVRWIAFHPREAGRLWVAIEAGALVWSSDGGRSWRDRVPGGPRDTHELAIHRDRPDTLRVSAGDGYFESHDGGATWTAPRDGLDVGYLRSVTTDPGDPDTVVVSASSHAHRAYVAGRSDGRLYRRVGGRSWERILNGWPDPPRTIAPLLASGRAAGELWAADERGVHRSMDGGSMWDLVSGFEDPPDHLRGLALVEAESAGAVATT
jgi:photosystem II stability/assembly factor-like uncharacterized protein